MLNAENYLQVSFLMNNKLIIAYDMIGTNKKSDHNFQLYMGMGRVYFHEVPFTEYIVGAML